MIRTVLLVFLGFLLTCTAAPSAEAQQEVHSWQWLYGHPQDATPNASRKTNDLVITPVYTASSNDTTKFADWVAYTITPGDFLCHTSPNRNWSTTPDLEKEETLETDDYDKVGSLKYDRGHQAPLASFKCSRFSAWTNRLVNITPQKSELNQGPWRILEEEVRNAALRYKQVWVLTGPLFERTMPKLPKADEPHTVPSGYWKVIYAREGKTKIRSAAFIMDQSTPRKSDLRKHVATLKEVEQRSKLKLFPFMPTQAKQAIETKKNVDWLLGPPPKPKTARPASR